MSNWEKYLKKKEDFLKNSEEDLFSLADKLKVLLYTYLIDDVLNDLIEEESNLKNSQDNYIIVRTGVNKVFNKFQNVLIAGTDKSKSLLSRIIDGIKSLLGLNKNIYATQTKRDIEKDYEYALRIVFQNLGYDSKNNKVIGNSWLASFLSLESTKIEVMSELNSAILAGMDLKTFKKRFKVSFTQRIGTKDIFWNRITSETFYSLFDRQISELYRRRLGLEYFIFTGAIIAKSKKSGGSREWCLHKKGLIFHSDIFEKWDSESWSGKIDNVPVVIQQGGYGCVDNFAYISKELAYTLVKQGKPHGLSNKNLKDLKIKQ